MAAEKNITGFHTQVVGGATELAPIDLGLNTINVLKTIYFSSASTITSVQVGLSTDGVASGDLIFSPVIPNTTPNGFNIIPPLSSIIVIPPNRYLSVFITMPGTGNILNWALNYISFSSLTMPLLGKFLYNY